MGAESGSQSRMVWTVLGVLALVLIAWSVWHGGTSGAPAEPGAGTTEDASGEPHLAGRVRDVRTNGDADHRTEDLDDGVTASQAEPSYRSEVFPSTRLLSDLQAGGRNDELLSMLVMMLTMERGEASQGSPPTGPAVLPGMIWGQARELNSMTPLLLGILEFVWGKETRSKAQVEAAQAILEILVSKLGAPAVSFEAGAPAANAEALAELERWFEERVREDAAFEAMLRGGGHPKFAVASSGLVGVAPSPEIEVGDPVAFVELGNGLRVEAFTVDEGGPAALLRGVSWGAVTWSVLLTDADGEPYRLFHFHGMGGESLGSLGWRVRVHVRGQALDAYLTPEGAFRFYHVRAGESAGTTDVQHLLSLVSEGDVDGVRRALDSGADPNAKGEDEETLLHLAAAHGHADVAALLIERRAVVEAPDELGVRPLQLAAFAAPRPPWESKRPAKGNEHVAVVRLLLEHGAQVSASTDDGSGWGSPLSLAALAGHVPMVRFLLEKGADPNPKGSSWRAPLYQASRQGVLEPGMPRWSREGDHIGVVRVLLDGGADPKVSGSLPGKLLRMAFDAGATDLVERLLDSGAIAGEEGLGTALRQACRAGRVPLMKRLLEAGASLDAVSKRGDTMLNAAAQGGRVEAIRFLLEKGSDPRVPNQGGDTPLHKAASSGHVEAVRLLLEAGAVPTARDSAGNTPLHDAALFGHADVLALLLERGGDVATLNGEGESPLHVAAGGCLADRATLELLVTHGADLDAKTSQGKTALQLAREQDCLMPTMIAKYLRELGAKR